MPPVFCHDRSLGFLRSRTPFHPSQGLALDDSYRLAQLPLVAPHHPRVIPSRDGTDYRMGRHRPIFSVVIPIPEAGLYGSAAFRALRAEMQGAPFAPKIAWDMEERRRDKLHATICGELEVDVPPRIAPEVRDGLRSIGPVRCELRGLFSGNVNHGRLYARLYPECRAGANVIHAIQEAMGRKPTDLYVAGLWNLLDDLDAPEAGALGELIARWWPRTLLRWEIDAVSVLGSTDDLALDSEIVETLPLTR